MGPQADFYTSINHFVNTQEWLTGILSTATSALFIWIASHLWRVEGRLVWRITNNVAINQGDQGTAGGSEQPSKHKWNISYEYPGRPSGDPAQQASGNPYSVTNGSLVFFELWNNWWRPIRRSDYTKDSNEKPNFGVHFPGRTVVSYKVRGKGNGAYRRLVEGAQNQIQPVFQLGQGLSRNAITQAFVQGGTDIPGLSGYDIKTVGRPRNSGTREAFIQTVTGGNDMANGTVPTEDTTMDLLGYVDTTPDSIGYAEADALPFFPYVREIAIDGVLPTRANALNDTYHFLATEHLYTNGPPTGLAADLISFLTSSPEVAHLQDTSFIGCADLAATALSADCTDN